MRLPIRPTVRLRLTLLYGALIIAAGVVLIAPTYGLVNRALKDREPPKGGPVGGQFGSSGGSQADNPGGNQGEIDAGFAGDGGTAEDGRTFDQQLDDARQE